jgi:hypothetical protein
MLDVSSIEDLRARDGVCVAQPIYRVFEPDR